MFAAAGEEVFRREADAFLASLPAGWQERWRRAVRQAAAGDGRALAEVRRSRNGNAAAAGRGPAVRIAPRMMLYVPAAPSASVTSVVPVSSAAHAASASGPLPLLVYFHGGGWVLGGIGSCARFCAELAAAGHVLVLAADYRLAPEHPFPQGLDDCMRAVETALRRASEWGGSPERVSVGGDSSGGNLALAVALRRRAEGLPPLRSLVLFYPVVTARADGSASWKRYGQGAALDGTLMETFSLAYASGREEFPLVSPAAASDAELAGCRRCCSWRPGGIFSATRGRPSRSGCCGWAWRFGARSWPERSISSSPCRGRSAPSAAPSPSRGSFWRGDGAENSRFRRPESELFLTLRCKA